MYAAPVKELSKSEQHIRLTITYGHNLILLFWGTTRPWLLYKHLSPNNLYMNHKSGLALSLSCKEPAWESQNVEGGLDSEWSSDKRNERLQQRDHLPHTIPHVRPKFKSLPQWAPSRGPGGAHERQAPSTRKKKTDRYGENGQGMEELALFDVNPPVTMETLVHPW